MKKFVLGLVLAIGLLPGCAGKITRPLGAPTEPKNVVESDSQKTKLSQLLEDENALVRDSEFSINFPQAEGSGIRTLSVKAKDTHIKACASSAHKKLKSGALDLADYREMLTKLRQLSDEDFSQMPAECKEPFRLSLRVADRQRSLKGCRGSDLNASIVSKLARELEFLLIKKTSN